MLDELRSTDPQPQAKPSVVGDLKRPFEWTRVKGVNGTELHAVDGRVVVRKITWRKPGFKNQTSTGWPIFVDGEQYSGGYATMRDSARHADCPGTARDIRARLAIR